MTAPQSAQDIIAAHRDHDYARTDRTFYAGCLTAALVLAFVVGVCWVAAIRWGLAGQIGEGRDAPMLALTILLALATLIAASTLGHAGRAFHHACREVTRTRHLIKD